MSLNKEIGLGQPLGISFIEKFNGINGDIINAIHKNFPQAVEQTKGIAHKFEAKTDLDTCYNLWKFERLKLTYKKDPLGKQQIRLPNRFIADAENGKGGDCKSYSLFSAAVLYNLGFTVWFQYVAYTVKKAEDGISSHVFVKAEKNGQTFFLDGCNKRFNTFTGKLVTEKKMTIETLSGIDEQHDEDKYGRKLTAREKRIRNYAGKLVEHTMRTNQQMAEIEEYIGKKGKGKGFLKKAWQGFKKINLAPQRGAFLALIRLNARGLAYKFMLAKKHKEEAKVDKFWTKLGGDPKKFWKNVAKGAKKKPLLGSKIKKGEISQDIGSAIAIGALLVSAGTVLAAAKPIFTAIKGVLKKKDPKAAEEFGDPQGAGGADGLTKDIKDAGGDVTAPPEGAEIEQNGHLDKDPKKGGFMDMLKNPLVIGGAVVTVGGLAYLATRGGGNKK